VGFCWYSARAQAILFYQKGRKTQGKPLKARVDFSKGSMKKIALFPNS
jgi:hypothetical protein